MKRIAIFCDGTWNIPDRKDQQTNVVQLAQAVRLSAEDGTKQVPIYVRGVGTGRGSNAVARFTDKWLGGPFGWGLDGNILEAYRALLWLYEPGDEIYIFGFSRGAYTARSLAGLIRKAGILSRDKIDEVGKAMALYRTRGSAGHPDADKVQAARAEMSPDVATSLEDLSKRDKPTELLRITYLGVLDTVGALGVPGFLGWVAKVLNADYSFHDTALSSSVASARHAVALDERRKHYPPSLWDNLADLNQRAQRDAPRYLQMWFAGDHGSIGGGGEVRGLSAYTLGWIAEGAMARGLEMDPDKLAAAEALCNPADPVHNKRKSAVLGAITMPVLADRDGPDNAADVHPSVLDKIRLGAGNAGGPYKPGSLARVWNDLPGLLPEGPERKAPDAPAAEDEGESEARAS